MPPCTLLLLGPTPSCSLTVPHQHREGTGDAKQGKLPHLSSMLLPVVLLLVQKAASEHKAIPAGVPALLCQGKEPSSLSILNCYSKIGNKGQQVNREQMKSKLLLPRLQGSKLVWSILLRDQTQYMNPPPHDNPCLPLEANPPP